MTNSKALIFPLAFDSFAIELVVNERFLAEGTAGQKPDASDFAFLVGEIWLRLGEERYLVLDEFNAGNMLQLTSDLIERFQDLPAMAPMPTLVLPGGWCMWMYSYWQRIDEDQVQPEDELNCDLLSTLSFAEGLGGRIAIYKFDKGAIFEVGVPARFEAGSTPVCACAAFNPAAIIDEVLLIRKKLLGLVRNREAEDGTESPGDE